MTSPETLRDLKSYIGHQHWGKNYGDVLRFLEVVVTAGDAVLVSDQIDQDIYRRWGWQCFEVMETEDKLIVY